MRATRHLALRSRKRLSLWSKPVKATMTITKTKAVIGGWLVALIAWMVAASQDTISQIFFTWLLVLLIPATGLAHCIAGSAEVLISVFSGETSWAEYLGRFLVPATLGNTIGGLVLVTLLNYGQVVGSGRKG
jgi:formate/nitrite transporter FocA (FNT family)